MESFGDKVFAVARAGEGLSRYLWLNSRKIITKPYQALQGVPPEHSSSLPANICVIVSSLVAPPLFTKKVSNRKKPFQ